MVKIMAVAMATAFLVTFAVAQEMPPVAMEPKDIPPFSAGKEETPSLSEGQRSLPDTLVPQDVPTVSVEEDPTKIFPDPPSAFPDPPAQQNGTLTFMVQQLSNAAQTVCAGRDDCVRTAGNFARFLWNNRDKADMQSRAAMCLGQSAVQRGYIQAPMEAIRNASTTEMMSLSVEICECMIGYLGRFGLCRPALVQGNLAPLMRLFGR